MQKKLTLIQIWNVTPALDMLVQKELPARTQYMLSRMLKKLAGEYEQIREQLIKVEEKHGEKNEHTGKLNITNQEAYQKEVEELMTQEVELDLYPIKIDDLDGIKLKGTDMMALEVLIDEPANN